MSILFLLIAWFSMLFSFQFLMSLFYFLFWKVLFPFFGSFLPNIVKLKRNIRFTCCSTTTTVFLKEINLHVVFVCKNANAFLDVAINLVITH